MKMKLVFLADANCPHCKGSGYVTDRVPYGSTTASFDSECDCAIEKLAPEDYARHSHRIDDGDYEVQPALEYEERMKELDRQQCAFEEEMDKQQFHNQ